MAKEVSPEWSLGIEIFAEWDPEDDINIGPGKRHPGLSLLPADRKEIPVLFEANPKASMTSTILKETFKKMDELGITQRGVDEDGKTYTDLGVPRTALSFLPLAIFCLALLLVDFHDEFVD